MFTAVLAVVLVVVAVLGAEFVRAQCRRMLSQPQSRLGARPNGTQRV